MKKVAIFTAIIFTIALIVFLVSNTPIVDVKLTDLVVSYDTPICSSEDNSFELTNSGEVTLLSGTVNVPTPCHNLKGSYEIENSITKVYLISIATGEICIQCVGSIDFTTELPISNNVEIYLNDNLISTLAN